jgi:uncharacterized membrane protein YgdD (TMEM256/DUF423 family)
MKAGRVMALGALLVAAGTVAGAMGSHALRGVLTERQLQSLSTATEFQILNALGLILVGLMLQNAPHVRLRWCARMLVAGIACFSGGIYIMLAGAPRWLGMVTPAGGVLLIAAWLLVAWHMFTAPASRQQGG